MRSRQVGILGFGKFEVLFVGLSALLLSGCGSGGGQTTGPSVDPQAAVQQAFASYDTNSDKKLDATELEKCPALGNALRRMDANKDKAIDEGELTNRLQAFSGTTTNVAASMFVSQGRTPLAGATIVLEPEEFMGDAGTRYEGKTDDYGFVIFDNVKPQDGLHPGFYRMRITPAGGAEVVQGCEIANDIPDISRMQITI